MDTGILAKRTKIAVERIEAALTQVVGAEIDCSAIPRRFTGQKLHDIQVNSMMRLERIADAVERARAFMDELVTQGLDAEAARRQAILDAAAKNRRPAAAATK